MARVSGVLIEQRWKAPGLVTISIDNYFPFFNMASRLPSRAGPTSSPQERRPPARPPLFSKGNVLGRGWGRSGRNAEGTSRHNRVMPFLVACSRFPYGQNELNRTRRAQWKNMGEKVYPLVSCLQNLHFSIIILPPNIRIFQVSQQFLQQISQ